MINSRQLSCVGLLLFALALGLWNAATTSPILGYDSVGHAAYIMTIADEGRLPQPLEGWSTFHPPFYYFVSSLLWSAGRQLSGWHLGFLIQCLSLLAILGTGMIAYCVVRRMGGTHPVSLVAMALTLFIPSTQMASVMIGNEAFAVLTTSAALLLTLNLNEDHTHIRLAFLTGFVVGLAIITKYTGIWIGCASLVPFLRGSFNRVALRSFVAFAFAGLIVVAPVYVRNQWLCGTPFPMTRNLEPMKAVEANSEIRPRQITDYLWINPQCVLNPSIYYAVDGEQSPRLNRTMTNVWGAMYASTWSDAFGFRLSVSQLRTGSIPLTVLSLLGTVPTVLTLFGFGLCLLQMWKRGSKIPEEPLVWMTLIALASCVVFTFRAPSLAATKGSYFLPLAIPCAVFFQKGIDRLSRRWRNLCLAVTILAVVMAAVLFTQELVFPAVPEAAIQTVVDHWTSIGKALPDANIVEVIDRLRR